MSRLQRIDHVGIAVADYDEAVASYARLWGVGPSHEITVEHEGVRVAMFNVGESKIELLAAIGADSAFARSVAKRGEGLHHICYTVADLEIAVAELKAAGLQPLGDIQPAGAEGKPYVFFHPRDLQGVLTELIAV